MTVQINEDALEKFIPAVIEFLKAHDIDTTKWHELSLWVRDNQAAELCVNPPPG